MLFLNIWLENSKQWLEFLPKAPPANLEIDRFEVQRLLQIYNHMDGMIKSASALEQRQHLGAQRI
jgi:hypothetical protein